MQDRCGQQMSAARIARPVFLRIFFESSDISTAGMDMPCNDPFGWDVQLGAFSEEIIDIDPSGGISLHDAGNFFPFRVGFNADPREISQNGGIGKRFGRSQFREKVIHRDSGMGKKQSIGKKHGCRQQTEEPDQVLSE